MTAVAKRRAQECSSEGLYYFRPKYPFFTQHLLQTQWATVGGRQRKGEPQSCSGGD